MQSIIIWLIFFLFSKPNQVSALCLPGPKRYYTFILYLEYQGVLPVVRISAPLQQASVSRVSPPLGTKGGGGQHYLAGEVAGEPIWTTREKAWHSVYSVAGFHSAFFATVLIV